MKIKITCIYISNSPNKRTTQTRGGKKMLLVSHAIQQIKPRIPNKTKPKVSYHWLKPIMYKDLNQIYITIFLNPTSVFHDGHNDGEYIPYGSQI